MFKFLRRMFFDNDRKHERHISSGGVKAMCVYVKHGNRVEFPVLILDVSEGGAKLSMGNFKIFPKSNLEISLESPDRQKKVTLRAEVLRTYRRHHEGAYYSGVRFKKGCEDAVKVLLELI